MAALLVRKREKGQKFNAALTMMSVLIVGWYNFLKFVHR